MKIKKLDPKSLEKNSEKLARKVFLEAVKTMAMGEVTNFFIRTDFQFSDGDKPDHGFMLIGKPSGAWLNAFKNELKKDKKQVLIGEVSKDEKFLYLSANKGNAKPSIIKKQLKSWIKKSGLQFKFEAASTEQELRAEQASTEAVQNDENLDQFKLDIRSAAKQVKTFANADAKVKKSMIPSLKKQIETLLADSGDYEAALAANEKVAFDKIVAFSQQLEQMTANTSVTKVDKESIKTAVQQLQMLIEKYQSLS